MSNNCGMDLTEEELKVLNSIASKIEKSSKLRNESLRDANYLNLKESTLILNMANSAIHGIEDVRLFNKMMNKVPIGEYDGNRRLYNGLINE